jgi:hypothetical protein
LLSRQTVSYRPLLYRGFDFNQYREVTCHARAESPSNHVGRRDLYEARPSAIK